MVFLHPPINSPKSINHRDCNPELEVSYKVTTSYEAQRLASALRRYWITFFGPNWLSAVLSRPQIRGCLKVSTDARQLRCALPPLVTNAGNDRSPPLPNPVQNPPPFRTNSHRAER